jgi:hypothetical protein
VKGELNRADNRSYGSSFAPKMVSYRQSWQCYLAKNCADNPTGPITKSSTKLGREKLDRSYLLCGCKPPPLTQSHIAASSWIELMPQPVEKVFCRALQSSKMFSIAYFNANSYLLKLSTLGFSTGWPISYRPAKLLLLYISVQSHRIAYTIATIGK